jgi:hypothetical protein
MRRTAMLMFLVGAATGYVFGTKAGRERYEEILEMWHQLVDQEAVQEATEAARAKVNEAIGGRS